MAWYTKQPKKTRDFRELTKTYNQKYGEYNYAQDSRALDRTFTKTLLKAVGDIQGKRVLVCGANSGYEINILKRRFPTARCTAVDISTKALAKLPKSVRAVHANFEQLPFDDREFDLYLNCRAIQSSNVHLSRALAEAKRVTKGKIVISIPNGYVVNGKLMHGMYNYRTRKIDTEKPHQLVQEIEQSFVTKSKSEAELFITMN